MFRRQYFHLDANAVETNPLNPDTLSLIMSTFLCFQFKSTRVTVRPVLMELPVVMMTKMFHYITATALATTVVKIVKVRTFSSWVTCQKKRAT